MASAPCWQAVGVGQSSAARWDPGPTPPRFPCLPWPAGPLGDAGEVLGGVYGRIREVESMRGIPSGVDQCFGLGLTEGVQCSACGKVGGLRCRPALPAPPPRWVACSALCFSVRELWVAMHVASAQAFGGRGRRRGPRAMCIPYALLFAVGALPHTSASPAVTPVVV